MSEEELVQQVGDQLLTAYNFPLTAAALRARMATAKTIAQQVREQVAGHARVHARWEASRDDFLAEQVERRAKRRERQLARRSTRGGEKPAAPDDSPREFNEDEPVFRKSALQTAQLAALAAYEPHRERWLQQRDADKTAGKQEKRRGAIARKAMAKRAHVMSTYRFQQPSLSSSSPSPPTFSSLIQSISSPSSADSSDAPAPPSASSASSPPRIKYAMATVATIYQQVQYLALERTEQHANRLWDKLDREQREREADREERQAEAEATRVYRAAKLAKLDMLCAQLSRGSSDNKENEHPNSS